MAGTKVKVKVTQGKSTVSPPRDYNFNVCYLQFLHVTVLYCYEKEILLYFLIQWRSVASGGLAQGPRFEVSTQTLQ